eukprot:TRINITY_DN8932_c0_g1_i1.p1 TRINITY_DN8932_c0_g1~~TRINITY_DN8932_c0_g1_i1.p1  ORF type:complete len:372 (-),score=43.26 TRINITY_DN8932_c0_g1_i1:134-1210(-)
MEKGDSINWESQEHWKGKEGPHTVSYTKSDSILYKDLELKAEELLYLTHNTDVDTATKICRTGKLLPAEGSRKRFHGQKVVYFGACKAPPNQSLYGPVCFFISVKDFFSSIGKLNCYYRYTMGYKEELSHLFILTKKQYSGLVPYDYYTKKGMKQWYLANEKIFWHRSNSGKLKSMGFSKPARNYDYQLLEIALEQELDLTHFSISFSQKVGVSQLWHGSEHMKTIDFFYCLCSGLARIRKNMDIVLPKGANLGDWKSKFSVPSELEIIGNEQALYTACKELEDETDIDTSSVWIESEDLLEQTKQREMLRLCILILHQKQSSDLSESWLNFMRSKYDCINILDQLLTSWWNQQIWKA